MKHLIFLTCAVATLLSATVAEARRGRSATTQELHLLAATDMTDNNGASLSLCLLTETESAMFINYWRSAETYALATNNCATESYYEVSAEQFALGQADGVFPADLPAEPQLTTAQMISGMWGLGALGAIVLFGVLGWLSKQIQASKRRKAVGQVDAFAARAAHVMGMAANADGVMDPGEVQTIQDVLRRITGTTYDLETIRGLIKNSAVMADDKEYVRLGKGMQSDHRELLVKAALMVVAADGDISPQESTFVSRLASGLGFAQPQVDAIIDNTFGSANPAE